MDEKPEPRGAAEGVAAVDRAFTILAALADQTDPSTLADLARRTGLYKSTIHRILASVENAGYAARLHDGRYGLGRWRSASGSPTNTNPLAAARLANSRRPRGGWHRKRFVPCPARTGHADLPVPRQFPPFDPRPGRGRRHPPPSSRGGRTRDCGVLGRDRHGAGECEVGWVRSLVRGARPELLGTGRTRFRRERRPRGRVVAVRTRGTLYRRSRGLHAQSHPGCSSFAERCARADRSLRAKPGS